MSNTMLLGSMNRKNVELYTPKYAVDMIIPYLDKEKVIWAPFDLESSNFVRYLRSKGFKVIHSHLFLGQDFMTYEPKEHYDIILSNPPFQKKKQWVDRCIQLGKPFALLLPVNWFNDLSFNDTFEILGKGFKVLIPNKRITFDGKKTNPAFKSAFFTNNLIKSEFQLIPARIEIVEELSPMYEEAKKYTELVK